ncbi:MAG: ABC transporter permease [Vicinamibacterales bacterium]
MSLRIAVRTLLRQPLFTAVVVATLALGIGATTAIFSVVYGVLLRPLPYADSGRLVAFGQTQRSNPTEPADGNTSHLNFLDYQRESRTLGAMALYAATRTVLTGLGDADVIRAGIVTPDFFRVFEAEPFMGRTFTREEDLPGGPDAVVVSYGFWQERLGARPDVLGQSVEISGRARPIVGVAPQGFDFPAGARVWLPVRNDDEQCGRGCVYTNGIARLAPGATVDAARQEMTAIAASLEREYPQANADVTIHLTTLQERMVGGVRLGLVILLAAVALVLLIACANVANLVMVRGSSRQAEIAVRAALGAGRRGILAFLLTENLVLAAAGAGLGLIVAAWGVAALTAMAPPNLPRLDEIAFDAPAFGFALVMVLATALLFGLGPSLRLARGSVGPLLGQRGSIGTRGGRRGRALLLVAEVGLSLVLLLGAGLLLRSLSALQRVDPGFRTEGLTTFLVSLPAARYPDAQVLATHEAIAERLRATPGVDAVARIAGFPLGASENVLNFTRPDRPVPEPGRGPVALYRVVTPDYFQTMGIPVVAGRNFTRADREGTPPAAIISQRLAEEYWPGEDPVGRPIRIMNGSGPGTVIGVVADVRSSSLSAPPQPELYVADAQALTRTMSYVVRSGLPTASVLTASRQAVGAIDARLPLISAAPVTALVDQALSRPRFYLLLLGLFAVLAVVLAAVGVYGVVSYAITERTREIGVRVALGAQRGEVVRMMLWQGLGPALAGVALGLVVAAAAGRVLSGLLYEIRPGDPLTFAGVTVVLLLVTVAACAIPARRASGVAPAEALRGD